MWKQMLGSRWFYVVAATGMVTLFLASQLEWTGDRREQGDARQIAELHSRDDVNLLFILIDTLRSQTGRLFYRVCIVANGVGQT